MVGRGIAWLAAEKRDGLLCGRGAADRLAVKVHGSMLAEHAGGLRC